ncbi:hypothetical protein [Horticoccus luteus]|uniref:hypothetical protein n=1 Tax=Horticoccus luteus TaxID=2862869 RepID=UPI002107A79E|nr:hypothetical protein [Horticoccus luteus]
MSAEIKIKDALAALFAGIARGDGAVVMMETTKLDDLLANHRAALHPQLRHFLEGRSYAKALMFLGGETDIPVGACGGGQARKAGGAGGASA